MADSTYFPRHIILAAATIFGVLLTIPLIVYGARLLSDVLER